MPVVFDWLLHTGLWSVLYKEHQVPDEAVFSILLRHLSVGGAARRSEHHNLFWIVVGLRPWSK